VLNIAIFARLNSLQK